MSPKGKTGRKGNTFITAGRAVEGNPETNSGGALKSFGGSRRGESFPEKENESKQRNLAISCRKNRDKSTQKKKKNKPLQRKVSHRGISAKN